MSSGGRVLYLLAAFSGPALAASQGYPVLALAMCCIVAVCLLGARLFDARQLLRIDPENKLAFIDELTGLPNRRHFLNELRACLSHPLGKGEYTVLFFADLDRFKGINDALGHRAGDRFLLEISARLQAALDEKALVARFGGDEFTILLNSVTSREQVVDVAERIMAIFETEVDVHGQRLWANTSVGVAMVQMPRPSIDDLIAMADAALYNAKAQGRGQYVIYEPNLPRPTRRSLSLDADIRTSISKKELELHYQPVVDLSLMKIVGLEALVRWNHPRFGLLSPTEFIPLAEQTGVIRELGAWVVEAACDRIAAWQGLYGESLLMSINLSALQFRQKDILSELARASRRIGLNANTVQLEITESVLMANDEHTSSVIASLRNVGFKIAIDDFGVGFSSLSYLRQFEIDTLKLDQSFLTNLEDRRTRALVKGTIQLGHDLGMKVVAEGIESRAQLLFLQAMGCDEGQGFLLSRPLTEADLVEHFTEYGTDIALAVLTPANTALSA